MSTATTNKQVKKIRRCGPYLNCGENKDRTMDKKQLWINRRERRGRLKEMPNI